ncbi:ion transporter [Eubacterium sp. AB3007]|uniref:ion transporter n=1 Tax=Eubacterium sp. AB3007 TaxID=1392487 RepID=UPI001FA7E6A8|nr:ion transporter [Eubacterium sp. AB3007]
MGKIRRRIFDIVEAGSEDWVSQAYDVCMIAVIVASLVPLAFKYTTPLFWTIERVAVCVFILDYLLRWGTADLKLKKGMKSFLVYPFTFMAIIDLLSILPVLTVLNEGFRSLRVLRLFTTMRVLRVFKILRYSRNINIIVRVFRKQKDALIVVGWLVVGYIFVTALVVFNMEPRTFTDFFHALYWATISLTTVGYGDVYPMSTTGRFITMLSSVVGVAVIALPSSILTVGYLAEITEEKEEKRDDE